VARKRQVKSTAEEVEMFLVEMELKGESVFVRMVEGGKPVQGYEFKVEAFKKKEWESRRQFCLREARKRNSKSKKKESEG
jgi:hypothetical protein